MNSTGITPMYWINQYTHIWQVTASLRLPETPVKNMTELKIISNYILYYIPTFSTISQDQA